MSIAAPAELSPSTESLRVRRLTFREICSGLKDEVRIAQSAALPHPNHRRDQLLSEYREHFLAQVRTDTFANLRDVSQLSGQAEGDQHLLSRMHTLCQRIVAADPYADGRAEERWWLDLHQFYLDGLALADRSLRPRRRRGSGREVEAMGLKYQGRLAAVTQVFELLVPHLFRVSPFRTWLPTLLHIVAHNVFPDKRLRYSDMLASGLGWVRCNGFAQMRRCRHQVIRVAGISNLFNAGYDRETARTRHNLIVAVHHRLGYIDLPVAYYPWRPPRVIIWANNVYGPGMSAKIARHPDTPPVRGQGRLPLAEVAARTADLLVHARIPMFTFVDGSQPPLFYGHQLRVKSGIRAALNATVQAARGTGRKTLVVPLTLNDPVGFVQGVRDTIEVRFHPPLEIEAVWDRRVDGGDGVNGGDPILNHLEALFISETSAAELGLPKPNIVGTARTRLASLSTEPLPKRFFPATMTDLACHAAAENRGGSGGS